MQDLLAGSLAPRWNRQFEQAVQGQPLWLAWGCATGMTLGSLYLSEVKNFIPCQLCWVQRGFAYPLALVLLIAAWRNTWRVRLWIALYAAIGACASIYHMLIERVDWFERTSSCSATEHSCAVRWIDVPFDLQSPYNVTIPVMALCGFLFIIATMRLIPSPHLRKDHDVESPKG